MSVLRRGSASARRTAASQTVRSEINPYGSRRLVVETDGVVTSASLLDARDRVVGAVWVANHVPAPDQPDHERLESGAAPLLPAAHARSSEPRPALRGGDLDVVWFEEGDGVAVLEDGAPLFVIPGWSDMGRGIPGYSRDATAQSPFAFPLDDEGDAFGERVEHARRHWAGAASPEAFAEYQQSVLGHLLQRLGPGGHYWHDVGRGITGGTATAPTVGLSERPPQDGRDFAVLGTVGMSRQRMPTIEQYEDDVAPHARVELTVATRLPSKRAGAVFPWLAQYPWRSVTWFAPGDVVRWYHEAGTFPLGGDDASYEGVLLLDDPSRLAGPVPPGLTGLTVGGDPVHWLWLVPITGEEHRYAKNEGSDALVRRLAQQGRSWVVG